ncbi:MAG: CoA transferase [Deltaproteobacteria bacterium]|nr:CoA transferase [Deltaproteobacteria bacterium]
MSDAVKQSPSAGPLEGLRVVELSTMMAGPYAATLLGDLGADVIKVESHYGDESRHLGPERDGERSAFLSLNRNKRDIVLDLRRPEAQEAFARLAATADIFITNIREPALSRLELDYEQVRRHCEDIIWVGVTAFGADGPYAGRPGIDFLIQGYAGLLALNGEPEGPPVRVTVPLIDTLTSVLASTAVLAAVHSRTATGKGQRIDISLLDALIHAQAAGVGSYLVTGEETPRTGNRSLYFAPSGIYGTKDGRQVVITCPSQRFFSKLCAALDVDWESDPRFENVDIRAQHQDELDQLLEARCNDFGREELMERLIAADVLTAPVNSVREVPEDPQIRHNRMIVTTEHEKLGPVKVTGVPIHLQGTPGSVRRASPLQGQHTEEILAEIGYAPEQIAELVANRSAATSAEFAEGEDD